MKKKSVIIFALLIGCKVAVSQDSAETLIKLDIEMRPAEKRLLTLKPSERNPYAKRVPQDGSTENEEQNTEELAIRKKLGALDVSGSSRNYNGLRLLFGDILVERGMVLPQLIANQTQHLKVVDVADEKIVLGWLDVESGELTGKTMQIPYDVKPVVRYVLQGQVSAAEGGVVTRPEMGVLRPKRDSRERDFMVHQ